MKRSLEPELMTDVAQARAYAAADFSEPHEHFIELYRRRFGDGFSGRAVDLGCGPGDISFRFARAFPKAVVHGVDGSSAMLAFGLERLADSPDLAGRVQLVEGMLPGAELPEASYDTVISNSLLHHLPDPAVLWESVVRFAREGAPVFVMDLVRPASKEHARDLVDEYAEGEPEILRRDFYNSLLAAFEPGEVRAQLRSQGLGYFVVDVVSDRHLIVSGVMR